MLVYLLRFEIKKIRSCSISHAHVPIPTLPSIPFHFCVLPFSFLPFLLFLSSFSPLPSFILLFHHPLTDPSGASVFGAEGSQGSGAHRSSASSARHVKWIKFEEAVWTVHATFTNLGAVTVIKKETLPLFSIAFTILA